MTPEEQQIAIAEACGWKNVHGTGHWYPPSNNPMMNVYGHTLPDYPNDLNAMHEAEMELPVNLHHNYMIWLDKIIPKHSDPTLRWHCHAVVCATAAQRAEAFLRTLNLWKQ